MGDSTARDGFLGPDEVTPAAGQRLPSPDEPTIAALRRELGDVRRKVGELESRLEEMVASHNDLDNRVDDHGDQLHDHAKQLGSHATFRDRIEGAVEDVQREVGKLSSDVSAFISRVSTARLLEDRKDRKVNAVLMALITKWELPVDLNALDEPEAAHG